MKKELAYITADYDRKLSECATKEEQLVNIINYKNRATGGIRESMRGDEEEMAITQ
jgi:hypothetical protein